MTETIKHKDIEIKVRKEKDNLYVLEYNNYKILSSNTNERTLEKFWRAVKGVQYV